jgi:hypothetical protein
MDVYILDSLNRRVTVVDTFESLIWTERFSAYGDFELVVYSTLENRNRFYAGLRLAIDPSNYVMIIETIQDSVDTQGNRILTIKGRSLEMILDNRFARATLVGTTASPKWVITDTPLNIAKKIFHDVCVTGVLDTGDIIPNVVEASIYPADTVAPPSATITYEIPPKTVYAALTDICNLYHMGFRLIRSSDSPQLNWDIYMGSDRTTRQTTLPAVVFSTDLENLQNTSELTSIAPYKNVAYVIAPALGAIVYAQDVPSTISGFDRHVLFVDASDITDTDLTVVSAKLIQRGNQELGKNRSLSAFDGELSQYSQYTYGVDYRLGDLVELRNDDGVISNMQVTEHIFVSDKTGEKSYPTLVVNQFIMPGTWLALPPTEQWADASNSDHWADH